MGHNGLIPHCRQVAESGLKDTCCYERSYFAFRPSIMAAQKARILHQRACRGTPCNPSPGQVNTWQVNKLKRPQGEALTPAGLPLSPPTQPYVISKPSFSHCRAGAEEPPGILAEKQKVLFETNGGNPASTWLSGSWHPSTAVQQAAHQEVLEMPKPAASNNKHQVIQGGSWVSGYKGGTTVITKLCLRDILLT